MPIDSSADTETNGPLVEITCGSKTYMVPKALADEVLRRREAAARRRRVESTSRSKPSKRRRKRARSTSGKRSRSSAGIYARPARGHVRLFG
jgi:hypothetical protein